MTYRQLRFLKCDGCEREVELDEANGWYSVQGIITNPEEYERIVHRTEETGSSGVISGDFCSLNCLADWGRNAETLRRMESDPEV